MDIQLTLVMIILAVTVGCVGVALWKKARQPVDGCATDCGCSGPAKTTESSKNRSKMWKAS